MSLDIFGGIVTANTGRCRHEMDDLSARLNVAVTYDSLDAEDCDEIDESMKSFGRVELYYSIHSPEAGPDATELWIEARALGMKVLKEEGIDPFVFNLSNLLQLPFPARYYREILKSSLPAFVHGLKLLSKNQTPSIALVDGGIERIKAASPDDCVKEILQSFVLPWDCSPNTLYIFAEEV